ncbi:outer membrane beta-barrel protein [Flavobacterium sp.]|uniref:outer membrane beta-barrel protein n=1 Tax=Flavobacterium sp. TaxID=239 RepID=UPI002FDC973E
MSERKNIDRLFQEKFKDFEVQPTEEVWIGLESKLREKKRKRVIPFWWKLSGVAALLIFGFLITRSFWVGSAVPRTPIVQQDNSDVESNKQSSDTPAPNNPSKIELPTTENTVATTEHSSEKKSNTHLKSATPKKASVHRVKTSIAEEKSVKHRVSKNKGKAKESQLTTDKISNNARENGLAENTTKNENTHPEKGISQPHNDNQSIVNADEKNLRKELNLDILKETKDSKALLAETDKKPQDSILKTGIAQNPLEELLHKKDSPQEKAAKQSRWQITSNVAPVFLGSTSNGSPIDSILVNNGKSYNTGIGFGLGVSYAVNKKLSVRTGLNKFNMSYNTNDIVFFADMQSRGLQNVKASVHGAMIHIENSVSPASASLTASENELLPFENSFAHKNKGSILQEMGYLEMPVEVTYALVDKRFGLKIIGGFSTLFLQNNEVSLTSGNRSTYLGEATNLNDVHFSTNLGLGLKYGFMKSFEFNLEPTFKYQINTFSTDSGNFKPYLFGIYSGFSYKF